MLVGHEVHNQTQLLNGNDQAYATQAQHMDWCSEEQEISKA